jgi:hypothetical protein
LRIEMVHPNVEGAESFNYQIWPLDESKTWIAIFGTKAFGKHCWRATTKDQKQLVVKEGIKANATTGVRNSGYLVIQKSRSHDGLPAATDNNKVRVYQWVAVVRFEANS